MSSQATTTSASEARFHRKCILACVDCSTFSEACIPHAVSLAKAFGSSLTIAHVMHSQRERSSARTYDALSWEIARQEARAYLDKLGHEAAVALGRPVDVRLEQGHPAERIVDLAEEIGADITVLASHGEGGNTARTLGSTAQQLLISAQTSVFIARSGPVPGIAVTPHHILVPLDGSVRSESALPAASHLARVNGASVTLVHVVQEPILTALLDAEADLGLARTLATHLESAAKRYLHQVQQRLGREGIAVETVVIRCTSEREGLLEHARTMRADLIILAAHGAACDPARSFGGSTTYLLTHSPIPLFVLQDVPELELHRGRHGRAGAAAPQGQARLAAKRE